MYVTLQCSCLLPCWKWPLNEFYYITRRANFPCVRRPLIPLRSISYHFHCSLYHQEYCENERALLS